MSIKFLRQKRLVRKFSNKYIGPFPIVRVSKLGLAYKLDLLKKYRMYYTFPISVLEEYHYPLGESPLPKALELEEKDTHEVKVILAHKGPPRNRWYKIRWKDYPPEEDSWEPRKSFNPGPLLKEYEDKLRRRK